MSSEKVDNDDPNYAGPDSKISTYAVIDKNMKSEDSTYDELNIKFCSEAKESYVSMKKDEVKKSLRESLCDKRFLCLLVAIIVIIVTSCVCFLLAFIQISQLRSETATVQQSESSVNNITATVDRMIEEKFNMLYHQVNINL